MRLSLKSVGRRLANRWWMWPLVLLALPNCTLDVSGTDAGGGFLPGDEPRTSAIMCDIPKTIECATGADLYGVDLNAAAVALVEGDKQSLGLDWSKEATDACSGMPRKINYVGPFPDGLTVCVNCAQLLQWWYDTPQEACEAKCEDEVSYSEFPPADPAAWCKANAKLSTNFPTDGCYDGVCSTSGTPDPNWLDPRRNQEPVTWVQPMLGVSPEPALNDLTRVALTTIPPDFNAGASSDQEIKSGDGWVEFSAADAQYAYTLGLAHQPGSDNDATQTDIEFGIRLRSPLNNNEVAVLYQGVEQGGIPLVTWAPGDRFRVKVKDFNNGQAQISIVKVTGVCQPGTKCTEEPIWVAGVAATYPLRVVARLRDEGAALVNVTLVRIK